MNEHEIQRDKALLSAAAYTNFFNKDGHKIDLNNDKLQKNLQDKSNFEKNDIEYFTTNFEVLHQQLETASGFLSVL